MSLMDIPAFRMEVSVAAWFSGFCKGLLGFFVVGLEINPKNKT
jgi:hypothetical protein